MDDRSATCRATRTPLHVRCTATATSTRLSRSLSTLQALCVIRCEGRSFAVASVSGREQSLARNTNTSKCADTSVRIRPTHLQMMQRIIVGLRSTDPPKPARCAHFAKPSQKHDLAIALHQPQLKPFIHAPLIIVARACCCRFKRFIFCCPRALALTN